MNEDQILAISVEARINKLEKEMKRASDVTGRNFATMERRSKRAAGDIEKHFVGLSGRIAGIGKSMAAGFVGGLVAGGVMGILGRGGELARGIAEIGDEAKRAGLGVEAFQELKYVAEQNRIGIDALTDGIKEMNLRADEFITTGSGPAAQAFQRLGYSADQLKAKLKDPSALFTEIIGKLHNLDRAAQIRIADEIFGGTGGERFVQLIERGEDAIFATRQEAHDLGFVMSEDLINRADELDRKFNAVANTVSTALKTAIVEAAGALMDFIAAFNAWVDGPGAKTPPGGLRQAFPEGYRDAEGNLNRDLEYMQEHGSPSGSNFYDNFALDADGKIKVNKPAPVVPIVPARTAAGGGGRSARGMREQRDAAAELIRELQDELRLMGQSDLEQRINAELRRAGAGATDAQKASIRELVTQIDSQSQAMSRLEQASENAKGIAKDFFGGLIGDLRSGVDGATALANAFGRLADRLIDMALDSLINSLFDSLLGGLGGGLFGGALGFAEGGEVHAATGGLIRGPGTSTSDSIPARLSDGEFVVNAAATRRNLELLHDINAGRIAAFAGGGLAGDGPTVRASNDNLRGGANDNAAPVVTINAPVTVNANGGLPEQNADLAKQVGKQMESTMRAVVSDELRRAMRPGNIANTRSR